MLLNATSSEVPGDLVINNVRNHLPYTTGSICFETQPKGASCVSTDIVKVPPATTRNVLGAVLARCLLVGRQPYWLVGFSFIKNPGTTNSEKLSLALPIDESINVSSRLAYSLPSLKYSNPRWPKYVFLIEYLQISLEES